MAPFFQWEVLSLHCYIVPHLVPSASISCPKLNLATSYRLYLDKRMHAHFCINPEVEVIFEVLRKQDCYHLRMHETPRTQLDAAANQKCPFWLNARVHIITIR